jgi:hypothetical protein
LDHGITNVLLEILKVGLLRIRAAADRAECALEADHLHNLPSIIQSQRPELLQYYLTAEQPGFARNARDVEQFTPLWDELRRLVELSK